jgi:tyrosyl-tRNA synthetase
LKYLAKVADAEKAWKEKADEINQGRGKHMLSLLEERGYVHQIAGYVLRRLLPPPMNNY